MTVASNRRAGFVVAAALWVMLAHPNEGRIGSAEPLVRSSPGEILVTSTSDDGPGSLREAIAEANVRPNEAARDRIVFDLPGAPPHVIALLSPLPSITDAVEIDGASGPASQGRARRQGGGIAPSIVLDGAGAGDASGLTIAAGGCVVCGIAIRGFSGDGIRIVGGGGSRIESSWIGASRGDDAGGNGGDGIAIVDSPGNVVGGFEGRAANVVRGNGGAGVSVVGALARSNALFGNSIVGN